MLVTIVTSMFFLATFLAALVAVVFADVVLRRRQRALQPAPEALAAAALDEPSPLLKEESLSTISVWGKLLEQFDFIHNIQQRLDEADLNWSVGRVTAMMLLTGTVATAALGSLNWLPLPVNLALAVGAATLPYVYILKVRARRFRRFQQQFPESLDSLCRALKAGYPIAVGIEMLAAEALEPVASEIRKTYDEWKLGIGWDQAMTNLSRRVPLVEVGLFAAAIRLHSRTGGRLGEVLAKIADSMREAIALEGEVRSIAAHGRLTGLILTVLPLGIAVMMIWVSPTYFRPLLEHPYGKYLILGAVGSLLTAHLVIDRIVDIEL